MGNLLLTNFGLCYYTYFSNIWCFVFGVWCLAPDIKPLQNTKHKILNIKHTPKELACMIF